MLVQAGNDSCDLGIHAVVLAGGSGTRFWPRSRKARPKQLCALGSSETMLAQTLGRLEGLVSPQKRLIVTHQGLVDRTRSEITDETILGEPCARNTAAALVLAALEVRAQGGDVMVSLHADHVIRNRAGFAQTLAKAVAVARKHRCLTLMGVEPSYAETGYGYIRRGALLEDGVYRVERFEEKPALDVAQAYLEEGSYYWNSGMFTWSVDVFLDEVKRWNPSLLEALTSVYANKPAGSPVDPNLLGHVYEKLPSVAVDDAILAQSSAIAVVPAAFDWQDVGSWDALPRVFGTDSEGNMTTGDVLLQDCEGCVVDAKGMLVAGLGLENMVVVVDEGVVLVAPRGRAQDVKKLVETLRSRGRADLL